MFIIGTAIAVCPTRPDIVPDLEPRASIIVPYARGGIGVRPEHVRVRGPNGSLLNVHRESLPSAIRLTPAAPMTVGEHTLEFFQSPRDDSYWFERQRFNVVRTLDVSDALRANYTVGPPTPFSPGVEATVEPPDDAIQVMLEVRGLGIVDVQRTTGGESVVLRPHIDGDPLGGSLEVRTIALGTKRHRSPWTTLSPGPGHLDGIQRWVSATEATPTARMWRMPECSCLEPTFTESFPRAAAVADPSTGALRVVTFGAWGELYVDGVPLPGLDEVPRAITEIDGAYYVLERGPWLSRIEGADVIRQRVLGLDAWSIRSDDGGLTLDWERDGNRWRQRAPMDLTSVSPPRSVYLPVRVDIGTVNGIPVDGLEGATRWAAEHYVAFRGDAHMNIVGPYGEIFERFPLEERRRVLEVTLFEGGIDVLHTAATPPFDDGVRTVMSWEPGPLGEPVEPRATPRVRTFDHDGRQLAVGRGRAYVRRRRGTMGPRLPQGQAGIRHGDLAVAVSDGDGLTVSGFRCERKPVIPLYGW